MTGADSWPVFEQSTSQTLISCFFEYRDRNKTTGPPQAHLPETKNEKTENHDGHNQDHENNGPKKQHTRHPQYTRRYSST